jgi:hypothetical protein
MDVSDNADYPLDSPIQQVLQSLEARDALLEQLGTLGQIYVGALLSGDKMIDHVYGIYYNDENGDTWDKSFDVDKNDNILVGGKTYVGTPGLYELIFKRFPNHDLYTEKNQRIYRNILATNAHRRERDSKLPILANKGFKYKHVIASLMHFKASKKKVGAGDVSRVMTVTDNKIS